MRPGEANYYRYYKRLGVFAKLATSYIFNIKGNHYRLLTIIHYRYKRIYIQEFFTHAAYDRWTRTHRQG